MRIVCQQNIIQKLNLRSTSRCCVESDGETKWQSKSYKCAQLVFASAPVSDVCMNFACPAFFPFSFGPENV